MRTVNFDQRRVRTIRSGKQRSGPVIYAMGRDQRVNDNWALLYARNLALTAGQSVIVAIPLAADYPDIEPRQARFMIAGLREVEADLREQNIRMTVTSTSELPRLVSQVEASALITDYSPLKESRRWKQAVAGTIDIPFHEVDAHNVVPVWSASPKQEYGAYTLRPKINRLLPEFLTEFPVLPPHPFVTEFNPMGIDWQAIESSIATGSTDSIIASGETAALERLQEFVSLRLPEYRDKRNDPNARAQSGLSPYLHFGKIAPQRVALEVQRHDDNFASQESFLEELIIRRELADNFCHYNENYDSFDGFPNWARQTLDAHRGDPRQIIYSFGDLEQGRTEDELWNAAQNEMVEHGSMPGYLRMYWAKKILEWSPTPESALERAITLNNRYQLDGHDPNGYVGIAWSIGGVHDRAWFEQEVFGKVRYMSQSGCKRKFDVAGYIGDRPAPMNEAKR